MSSSAAVRGMRCAELATSDPLSAAQFYRELLGWKVFAAESAFDCWVGDRRCASVRAARSGKPGAWRAIFAGGAQNGSLTGPDETHAGLVKGRAQHGPWAPPPRAGEPCWVDLFAGDGDRADMFWSDTLHWTVHHGHSSSVYAADGRPVAIRRVPTPSHRLPGWLCYFAVDDFAKIGDRVRTLDGRVVDEAQHAMLGEVLVAQDPHGAVFALTETSHWGAAQA